MAARSAAAIQRCDVGTLARSPNARERVWVAICRPAGWANDPGVRLAGRSVPAKVLVLARPASSSDGCPAAGSRRPGCSAIRADRAARGVRLPAREVVLGYPVPGSACTALACECRWARADGTPCWRRRRRPIDWSAWVTLTRWPRWWSSSVDALTRCVRRLGLNHLPRRAPYTDRQAHPGAKPARYGQRLHHCRPVPVLLNFIMVARTSFFGTERQRRYLQRDPAMRARPRGRQVMADVGASMERRTR